MSDKNKFTPGPWEATFSNLFGMWTVFDPFNSIIAELPGKKTLINDDEMGANAALIASAPDMAAEIERLRAIVKQSVAAMERGLQGLYAAQNYAYSLDNGHELREKIKKDIKQVLGAIGAAKGGDNA